MEKCQTKRNSICIIFLIKEIEMERKYYWEDEEERYIDVDNWYSKSPQHEVKYLE